MDHSEPAHHHRDFQRCVRRHGQHAHRRRARLFVLHGRQYGVDLLCQLRQQYSQYVCDKLTDFWQGVLPAPDDAGQPGADKPNQLRHSGGHVPDLLGVLLCHGQRRHLYAVGAGCAVRRAGGHAAGPRRRHHRVVLNDEVPRSGDCRRLRRAALDVRLPRRLSAVDAG